MSELTLELDERASDSIRDLMSYYRVSTKAEIISKAIAILKIACHIDRTDGELLHVKVITKQK